MIAEFTKLYDRFSLVSTVFVMIWFWSFVIIALFGFKYPMLMLSVPTIFIALSALRIVIGYKNGENY